MDTQTQFMQQQQQQQSSVHGHGQQWLQPQPNSSPYASPTSPTPSLTDSSYANIFQPRPSDHNQTPLPRAASALSLNMSGLTVASPSLSPHPSTAGSMASPITPISPSITATATPQQPSLPFPSQQPPQQQQQQQGQSLGPQPQAIFRYTPPDHSSYTSSNSNNPHNSNALYAHRPPGSSRSSTSSDKSVPRKRSSSTALALTVNVDNVNASSHPHSQHSQQQQQHTNHHSMYDHGQMDMPHSGHSGGGGPLSMFDDGDLGYQDGQLPSPMAESPSSTGFPDDIHGMHGMGGGSNGSGAQAPKPLGAMNNFVSKLYQMINDPKSARFINWTEHGTSFVVSNVGEFSRSILGAHFKHNNFSSFVRQLNMYGFSKINRTPRAQRASADSQTWEFAHSKFLRGRPDLLDEIRRKALEPDPSVKQRVELPGELASQLNTIRDENRRVVRALDEERQRNQRLVNVLKLLYDVIAKNHPGELPPAFPLDLLEQPDMPPIFITSPINNSPTHYAHSGDPMYQLHGMSPGSSPTAGEFPQHSQSSAHRGLPHIITGSYDQSNAMHAAAATTRFSSMSSSRYGEAPSSPSPINTPISGPEDDGGLGLGVRVKRQRTSPSPTAHEMGLGAGLGSVSVGGVGTIRRLGARARSDSAPLGQGLNAPNAWPGQQGQGRPRSGSGIAPTSSSPTSAGSSGGGMGGGLGLGGMGLGLGVNLAGGGYPILTVPNLPPMPTKEDSMGDHL